MLIQGILVADFFKGVTVIRYTKLLVKKNQILDYFDWESIKNKQSVMKWYSLKIKVTYKAAIDYKIMTRRGKQPIE